VGVDDARVETAPELACGGQEARGGVEREIGLHLLCLHRAEHQRVDAVLLADRADRSTSARCESVASTRFWLPSSTTGVPGWPRCMDARNSRLASTPRPSPLGPVNSIMPSVPKRARSTRGGTSVFGGRGFAQPASKAGTRQHAAAIPEALCMRRLPILE
jgi:hypothetical protein